MPVHTVDFNKFNPVEVDQALNGRMMEHIYLEYSLGVERQTGLQWLFVH